MNKQNIISQMRFSGLAAGLYCCAVFAFARSNKFESIWILYVGNIFFGVGVALFMLRHIQQRHEGASTTSMLAAGHRVAIGGILIAAAFSFLIMLLVIPHFSGHTSALNDPGVKLVQEVNRNTGSLVFTAYMNLVIGNMATGSFVSVIFAYTAKLNQTRDKESNMLKE